nr:transposase [Micromonospora inyonensis]
MTRSQTRSSSGRQVKRQAESANPADLLREQIEGASPDLLQAMVKTFAQALMSAEADAICGAGYGQRSDERVNSRNCRHREWDTRAGTIDLATDHERHPRSLSVKAGPWPRPGSTPASRSA